MLSIHKALLPAALPAAPAVSQAGVWRAAQHTGMGTSWLIVNAPSLACPMQPRKHLIQAARAP